MSQEEQRRAAQAVIALGGVACSVCHRLLQPGDHAKGWQVDDLDPCYACSRCLREAPDAVSAIATFIPGTHGAYSIKSWDT